MPQAAVQGSPDHAREPDKRVTGQIGQSQALLRSVHLKYHLTTAEVLTADQLQRYAQLRGYR